MELRVSMLLRQAIKSGSVIIPPGFIGRAMVMIESAFFPLVFLFFAAGVVSYFFRPFDEPMMGKDTPIAVAAAFFDLLRRPTELAGELSRMEVYTALGTTVVRPLLLLFFNLTCATFIAVRTGIRYRPSTLGEIMLPIMGTFMMMLLPLSTHIGWMGRPFSYPQEWMPSIIAIGTTLGIAGGCFAFYGLMYLKRNFSIFVEVREIVVEGPYRYVRHPMYAGELVMVLGLVMTMLSPFSVALLVALVLFQYLRARMEQNRLAMASPEYAKHMKRSGMFFPKLGFLQRS